MEERRRLLSEWLAWRERETEDLEDERRELGLDGGRWEMEKKEEAEEGKKVVEEVTKPEVLEETSEVVA